MSRVNAVRAIIEKEMADGQDRATRLIRPIIRYMFDTARKRYPLEKILVGNGTSCLVFTKGSQYDEMHYERYPALLRELHEAVETAAYQRDTYSFLDDVKAEEP